MNKHGRIERRETRIIVPHLNGELTAVHPFLKGTYFHLARQIDKAGLQRPTMAQTASLVHDAYSNPNEDPIHNEIKKIMKKDYFYAFNGLLYTPEGVYVQDNPEFSKEAKSADDLVMNEQNLQSRLSSNDPSIRFVPYGFKIEEQTYQELEKNPLVIALAGKEGAEKLAYIASQHKSKPYLFALENVKKPIKRVAGLDSYWDGDRLSIDGDNHGGNAGWCSFGVRSQKISSGNKG